MRFLGKNVEVIEADQTLPRRQTAEAHNVYGVRLTNNRYTEPGQSSGGVAAVMAHSFNCRADDCSAKTTRHHGH